jgi:hypothetical protein
MHIECQKCATRLTLELGWVSPSNRNDKMGEQMLKQGSITREDGSYFHSQVGVYIAHPDDAISMYLTSETKRLAGCCGLDGCDGPNLFCEGCKTYVATKMTDCWMPHCVVFDPNTTREVA